MPTRLMDGMANVAMIMFHSVNPNVSKSWSRLGMSWIDEERLPATTELRLSIVFLEIDFFLNFKLFFKNIELNSILIISI